MDLVAVRLGWPAGRGPSAFHAAPFSAPARRGLGQAEQQWYSRARAAVAKWGELSARAERIADAAYRGELQTRYRAPDDRRDAVAADVAAVEARAPADYSAFASSAARSRVEALEALNRDIEAHVAFGERGGAAPALEPLVVAALAAAGAAALLLLFFVID